VLSTGAKNGGNAESEMLRLKVEWTKPVGCGAFGGYRVFIKWSSEIKQSFMLLYE
jgi:hypothetical protein